MTEVAAHLGVTRPALSRVLNGKAGVSADMALRISEAFNTDPELWLRLQMQRDLWVASQKERGKVKPLAAVEAAQGGSSHPCDKRQERRKDGYLTVFPSPSSSAPYSLTLIPSAFILR